MARKLTRTQGGQTSFEQEKARKAKSSFVLHGSILGIASILVRIIGLVYRIPMTNILDTNGSAYYSSAYKIYSIVLLISSYSMPLAISKLVSARVGTKQFKNAYRVLLGGLLFALVVGGLSSGIVFFFAEPLADKVLNMPLAAIPLRILAPAIFIMSFLGVFRGYFQGLNTMIPTALSQIFEQIINAAVSVAAAYWLCEVGMRTDLVHGTDCYSACFGAAGGTLGTTLGALTALLFCLLLYLMERPRMRRRVRRDKDENPETLGSVVGILVMTIFPVLISSTAYNLLDIVDQSVFSYYYVPNYSQEQYEVIWGAYDNMYILMLHVPVALASAMASSTVPAISRSVAQGNMEDAAKQVKSAIRVTLLVAFPSAVGLGVLALPIMNTLFGGRICHEQAALFLMCGAVAVIFFSLSTVTNGILQGLGKIHKPVLHALISLVIHVVILLVCLLVFRMTILGVIYAYIVFGVVMSTLNILSIEKLLDMRQDWEKSYIKPAIASVAMGLGVYAVAYLCINYMQSYKFAVLFGIIFGAFVYFTFLFLLKTFDEEDLMDLPKGRILLKLAKKLHFL